MTSSARRRLAPALTCVVLASLASGTAHAIGCEELRGTIAEKMQRGGLTRPNIVILDAAEPARGRVVGTCESGSRKLVMTNVPAASPSGADEGRMPVQQAAAVPVASHRPARKVRTPEDEVLVECFDGKRYTDGPCRK